MEESPKERTAFTVGPLGFFEFVRMPFGLANSPTIFQRLMEQTLGELHMQEPYPFLDDISVPGRDFSPRAGETGACVIQDPPTSANMQQFSTRGIALVFPHLCALVTVQLQGNPVVHNVLVEQGLGSHLHCLVFCRDCLCISGD